MESLREMAARLTLRNTQHRVRENSNDVGSLGRPLSILDVQGTEIEVNFLGTEISRQIDALQHELEAQPYWEDNFLKSETSLRPLRDNIAKLLEAHAQLELQVMELVDRDLEEFEEAKRIAGHKDGCGCADCLDIARKVDWQIFWEDVGEEQREVHGLEADYARAKVHYQDLVAEVRQLEHRNKECELYYQTGGRSKDARGWWDFNRRRLVGAKAKQRSSRESKRAAKKVMVKAKMALLEKKVKAYERSS